MPSAFEGILKNWVTDAFLLAALSVGGYAVAYAFETGYAAHFGYPAYLITPTFSTIAQALFALVIFGEVVVHLVVFAIHQKDPELRLLVLQSLMALIAGAIAILVIPQTWLFAVVASLLALGVAVLWWMRARRSRQLGAVTAASQLFPRGLPPGGIQSAGQRLRRAILTAEPGSFHLWFIIITCLVTFFNLAHATGGYMAFKQHTFYMLKSKPDFVVLRIYGELVVAGEINRSTQSFTGNYLVGKLGDADMKLELSRAEFGKQRPYVMKP